ncbi:MAG TPA: hypothetical protein VHO69_02285 [Phototrophicaceae bacterium]|nr:hypothetical protein [Phototrophicaceae bacterium]
MRKYAFAWICFAGLVTCLSGCYPPVAKPTPLPETTTATVGKPSYQPFEHGFMLLSGSGDCVYVFGPTANHPEGNIIIAPNAPNTYTYCTPVGAAVAPLSLTPPPDLYLPTGAIGIVWNRYDLKKSLGYATHPEQAYTAPPYTGPTPITTTNGGPWSLPMATLPDGRTLWCGVRAATAGTCSLKNPGED